MRTSVEHDTDEKAPARAAETHRPAGAPSGASDARMLLGLQAMAGNAAVTDLIESRRPEPAAVVDLSPPPVTAEAPPDEESAVAAPRAGESDGELAALDAEAEPGASISPPDLGESDANPSPAAGEGGMGADPGTPIEEWPVPAIPDVSAADPAAGLARVGSLPPAQLLGSLGAVSTAVDRRAADEHERLAANAPERPRHPGAPSTVEAPAATRLALVDRPSQGNVPTMPEGHDVPVRLSPGALPHLPMEGSADPALIQQQHARVLGTVEREHTSGRQEATRPLGEDEIFPTAAGETLRGSIDGRPGQAGQAPGQPKPTEDDEAASIIAQQEKGAEIQSAVGTGLASLAGHREEYAQRTAGERARADSEMSQLEQANVQEQAGERMAAKREVIGLRGQWTTAQQEVVAGAQREAYAKTTETLEAVAKQRSSAEEQATEEYQKGQQEAQRARHEGEQQAATERQKAQGQNQGGLLGAIGSAAQSLFDKAKQAVQSVLDRARQLVRSAIERAQQLATAVMERARQAIVGAIRQAGTVLTAIGDRVLVAFPALRDRFRKAIQDRIAAAEATVNRLANALKQAVQTALNLLGSTLSAAIALLHQGMQGVLDGVRATVQGAMDFARGAMAAFGNLAMLVKDIAANPGRWIANLAAAVQDGIQNYLWVEIKTAVQTWFHEKVHEVVGVGEAIWHLLQRGGISIAEVARMAWEGLRAAIPGILIALLIEKIMSLIVPAVGAILTIIQAIQAGWASLGRIIQAFEAFFNFLKHVKLGSAGPLFAKAVAAGAIAAVEFVSNFLLARLKGAATSVSNRLRALARRIGERLRAIGGRVVRGIKAVGSGLRRAGQKVRAGFDRLRGRRPKSHAEQERAKHERQEAAFAATKSHLDALFAKGVSRARLATEVVWLKVRYRWTTLHLQGLEGARHLSILGGFSPERRVSEGDLILASEAEDLRSLLNGDALALTKLDQVQADPNISEAFKHQFIRKVTERMKYWAKRKSRPPLAGYEVMSNVVRYNRRRWTLLGPPISATTIREHGGLTRLIDARRVYRSMLRAKYKNDFPTFRSWIKAISKDDSLLKVHIRAGAKISGRNQVAFWSERYHGNGLMIAKHVEHLRLDKADYPSGAVRIVLPEAQADVTVFHKPTAFDGMPHKGWTAPDPLSVWGAIRTENAPDVREAVSEPVSVSSTTDFKWIAGQ